MNRMLRRIVRFRAMEEDLVRLELEQESARLRVIEESLAEAGREAAAAARAHYKGLLAEIPFRRAAGADHDARMEIAEWRREKAAALYFRTRERVEELRGKYLGLRKARRQMELIADAAEREERLLLERRAQHELDGWTQTRRILQSRRGTKPEGASSGETDP